MGSASFWSEDGYQDFFHFGLESGMVSKEPRECMNVLIVRVSGQLSVPNE